MDPLTVISIILLALAASFFWAGLWIRSQVKKAEKQAARADWSKVKEWEDEPDDKDDWGEPPAKS